MKKINNNIKDSARVYEQEYGFALVRLEHASKKAFEPNWNKEHKSVLDRLTDKDNIGILHKFSNTIAIDVDDEAAFEKVKELLKEMLPTNDKYFWELDTATSTSGKPNKGGKKFFKLPEGNNYELVKLKWNYYSEDEYNGLVDNNGGKLPKDAHSKEKVVFELRCGANQDALPPSLHPDLDENGNHYVYKWINDSPMLDAPEDLIFLLEHWADCEKFLKASDPNAWKYEKESRVYKSVTSDIKPKNVKSESYALLERFKNEVRVEDALEANGYKHNRKNRYVKPNSIDKKDDGIVVYPNNRVYAFNESDALADGHLKSSYDIYDLNLWSGMRWAEKEAEMCKILGIEVPEKKTKSKKEIPSAEEHEKFVSEKCKNNIVRLQNDGHPDTVLKLICDALKINNKDVSESSGCYVAFKNDCGVKMISYSYGEPLEYDLSDGIEIYNIVINKDKFYWDGGIDEKTGEHIVALPTLKDCERVAKSQSNDRLNLPTYDKISTGAFLDKNGKIISEFGSNIVNTNSFTDSNGNTYNVDYTVFMGHTVKIPEIPEKILPEHIEKAKEILRSCYDDFYFSHEWQEQWYDSVAYQNVVFMLAVCCFRNGFINDCAAPMFIVDKAVSGVGASYLQDVMCTQAFNLTDGKVAHGSLKYIENDDIQDVFSTLNSRQSVKIYDNIKNGCEKWYTQTLLDALTGTGYIEMRGFHTQKNIRGRKGTIFMGNGINVTSTNEIARRIIVTRLEKPQGRNLDDHKENRKELLDRAKNSHPDVIWAFKVFYDYWVQNGKKLAPKPKGNFNEYYELYNVIGSMLIEHYPNILGNLYDVQHMQNEDELNLNKTYEKLFEFFPSGEFSAKDLLPKVKMELDQLNGFMNNEDRYGEKFISYLYEGKIPDVNSLNENKITRKLKRLCGRDSDNGFRLESRMLHGYFMFKIIKLEAENV